MAKAQGFLAAMAFQWIVGAAFLLHSGSTENSLWGKKITMTKSGELCPWQLSRTRVVPVLEELSVCVDLWRQISTSKWTVFAYRLGDQRVELGLAGDDGRLKAWLFGKEWDFTCDLSLRNWHTVCLAWSDSSRKLNIFVNGTKKLEKHVKSTLPRRLAPNGTLTLGVMHSFIDGKIVFETGTDFPGQMTLFRIWSKALSSEMLPMWRCVDGDVVRWAPQDWTHSDCPPESDHSLKCEWSMYELQMRVSVRQNDSEDLSQSNLKTVFLRWFESIFPQDISVHSISLSPSRQSCRLSEEDKEKLEENGCKQNRTKENWFNSRVHVNVTPPTDVAEVQTLMFRLLRPSHRGRLLSLQVDMESLSVLSVATFPNVTGITPQTTVAPTSTTTNIASADVADTFYRVSLNFTLNGTVVDLQHTIQSWLQENLRDHKMFPLNVMLLAEAERWSHQDKGETSGVKAKFQKQKSYGCTSHIQARAVVDVTDTEHLIFNLLTETYTNDSISIRVPPDQIKISHIVPGSCPDQDMQTLYGFYGWPKTAVQDTAVMICERNNERATRLCKLDSRTDMAVWDEPNLSLCKRVVGSIQDLDKITVTANNSADVIDMIETLLRNQSQLNQSQLDTVLQTLDKVIAVSEVTPALAEDVISVVSNILESDSSLAEVTNEILTLTERVGDKMEIPGASHNMTAPLLALQLLNVNSSRFPGLTFGVSSFQQGGAPEIFLDQAFVDEPGPGVVASVSLPTALESFFPSGNSTKPRIQFHFYGKDSLFKDPSCKLQLNSYVVSASVSNTKVSDLQQPVLIALKHHIPKEEKDRVQCVYWDFQKNSGLGGWDSRGCETYPRSTHTYCLCNHLTHFGALLDIYNSPISQTDDHILTVISYLGCGISSIFLGITLLTYVAFEKLRRDYPAKILINLSVALLGLNLVYLSDSWLASFDNRHLCIAVGATLHYFFLATFTWMWLEALNMYLALVKVFNVYVPSYILKFCAFGWGLPLGIVTLVLAIDKDAYGNSLGPGDDSVSFCWLPVGVWFYVTVVSFVALVLLCNVGVFGVVMLQIRWMRRNKPRASGGGPLHNLRVVASLTFLLGLTWLLAFLSFGPARTPLLYIFSLLNSLQGFFIFVFHCLMKENVRKQWRIHLCCGRFRLSDHSDWSHSVTFGGQPKGRPLVHSPSMKSETTTDTRKISDQSNSRASTDET